MASTTALAVRPDGKSSTHEIVSGSGWVERGARVTTILLSGRLLDLDTDHLCRVRNVSAGGMMVECHAPVAVGACVRLELRHDIVVDAEVMWVDHSRMGLRACAPIDVRGLLGGRQRNGRQVPRSPRLTAAAAAKVSCSGSVQAGTLLDISQAGCRIAIAGCRKAEEAVRITIPGLPVRSAVQRWIREDQAGFVFLDPYSFVELSRWQGNPRHRFSNAGLLDEKTVMI